MLKVNIAKESSKKYDYRIIEHHQDVRTNKYINYKIIPISIIIYLKKIISLLQSFD